jgi:hypothetical protein
MRMMLWLVVSVGIAYADVPAPAKTYDAAQCKARVAVFAKRAKAAAVVVGQSRIMESGEMFAASADAGLAAPEIVVQIAPRPNTPIDACAQYFPHVVVKGKKPVMHKTTKTAVAAVKKQLGKDATIGVYLFRHTPMTTAAPVIAELAKLGTLAVHVVTPTRYPVVTTDAPAWALERHRKIEALVAPGAGNQAKALAELIRDGITDSARGCDAHDAALEKLTSYDHPSQVPGIAAEAFPAAALACACKNDVDAYELFTIDSFTVTSRILEEGWLELRGGPTKITAATGEELGAALGKLSLDERRAGLTIEASAAPSCKR